MKMYGHLISGSGSVTGLSLQYTHLMKGWADRITDMILLSWYKAGENWQTFQVPRTHWRILLVWSLSGSFRLRSLCNFCLDVIFFMSLSSRNLCLSLQGHRRFTLESELSIMTCSMNVVLVSTWLQGGLQTENQLAGLHIEESNLPISEGCDKMGRFTADQVDWRGDSQLWQNNKADMLLVSFLSKNKKSKEVNTQKHLKSILLSSLNTARDGEVVLASHSLTVPSAEQERRRWWALLYTKPQTESVCPHNAPRSTEGSAEKHNIHVRNHHLIWKSSDFNK